MIDLFDSIEESMREEEAIQENKQEATEEAKQEVAQSDDIDRMIEEQEEIAEVAEDPIQEVKQEETIQESEQEDKEIESSFKHYLKSIIPMQDFITQEDSDSISFIITIKKSDLMAFKQPLTYSSYEHSLKIKQGQENAKKHGRKPGLKKGSKRERKDKQSIIDQIKALSNSFNGAMNNHELAKLLNCSLNRICNYKREIKMQLKNTN